MIIQWCVCLIACLLCGHARGAGVDELITAACQKICAASDTIGVVKHGQCECKISDSNQKEVPQPLSQIKKLPNQFQNSGEDCFIDQDREIRCLIRLRKPLLRMHDAKKIASYFMNGGPTKIGLPLLGNSLHNHHNDDHDIDSPSRTAASRLTNSFPHPFNLVNHGSNLVNSLINPSNSDFWHHLLRSPSPQDSLTNQPKSPRSGSLLPFLQARHSPSDQSTGDLPGNLLSLLQPQSSPSNQTYRNLPENLLSLLQSQHSPSSQLFTGNTNSILSFLNPRYWSQFARLLFKNSADLPSIIPRIFQLVGGKSDQYQSYGPYQPTMPFNNIMEANTNPDADEREKLSESLVGIRRPASKDVPPNVNPMLGLIHEEPTGYLLLPNHPSIKVPYYLVGAHTNQFPNFRNSYSPSNEIPIKDSRIDHGYPQANEGIPENNNFGYPTGSSPDFNNKNGPITFVSGINPHLTNTHLKNNANNDFLQQISSKIKSTNGFTITNLETNSNSNLDNNTPVKNLS